MEASFGLLVAIGAGLLIVVVCLGAGLAFLFGLLSPRPANPPEAGAVPAGPPEKETLAARRAAYRLGIYVLIGLAGLTAIEFGIALALEGAVVFLFVIALVKAGVIVQYYMHADRLWGEEEAH